MKALTRTTTMQESGGLNVDEIDGGTHSISPEVRGNKSAKEKGTGRLQDMTVFAFSHPVLCMCTRTGELKQSTRGRETGAEGM